MGLSLSSPMNASVAESQMLNNESLTAIFNHLVKNVFHSKSIKTIHLSKTVMVYAHDRGLQDSALIDLSKLNLDDERIRFGDATNDSAYSLKIKKINHFTRKNKFELITSYSAKGLSQYKASYVYKRRRGIFKRWVYKRYIWGISGAKF